MRTLLLVAVLLVPTAVADHAVGHVVLPGGEVVEAVEPIVRERTGYEWNRTPIVNETSCSAHVDVGGHYFLGLPLPREIEEAYLECRQGAREFATPDPFAP